MSAPGGLMRGLPRRFLAAAATAAVTASLVVAATPTAAQAHGRDPYVKVGYFTQWGIYGREFPVAKLETSGAAARLTHINYAFSDVNQAGVCASADPHADWGAAFPAGSSIDGVGDVAGQPLSGNLNQFAELKKKHPDLKILIS